MNNRFFGYLSVVVGIFVSFAGSCFMLFGEGFGFFGLLVGVFLIATGAIMVRQS